jgi:hypothetical protein
LKNPNIEQESSENPALIKDGGKATEAGAAGQANNLQQRPRNKTMMAARPGPQNLLPAQKS